MNMYEILSKQVNVPMDTPFKVKQAQHCPYTITSVGVFDVRGEKQPIEKILDAHQEGKISIVLSVQGATVTRQPRYVPQPEHGDTLYVVDVWRPDGYRVYHNFDIHSYTCGYQLEHGLFDYSEDGIKELVHRIRKEAQYY